MGVAAVAVEEEGVEEEGVEEEGVYAGVGVGLRTAASGFHVSVAGVFFG